ncbi:DUF4913 domain-containing protein [Nocardia sp. XZ_19_231]|uniref:DUF4913 domain-containing protein n=1 Tax=Nocardia sp. XZ_19_231 TaxID=2769252 RepID=UPI00188FE9F0|nr:DUF4913 domain-containing protein [Nocardia sp. XZ_19_231]
MSDADWEELISSDTLPPALAAMATDTVERAITTAFAAITNPAVTEALEGREEEIRAVAKRQVDRLLAGSAPGGELRFRTLDEFVEKFVARVYRRDVSEGTERGPWRWCSEWWQHGEAVAKLSALWCAFENLRTGPGTEQAVFWVQFGEPILTKLLGEEGPFKYCYGAAHSKRLEPLPTVPAPTGMFADGALAPSAVAAPAAVATDPVVEALVGEPGFP